jgi:hypothetical protein
MAIEIKAHRKKTNKNRKKTKTNKVNLVCSV